MTKEEKKIPLVELFGPTVQGEGAVIGMQTYFLRFGLCDYLCKMCDSMHAVDPLQVRTNAEWLTQEEIFAKFKAFRKIPATNWVTFSGGNPCIHNLASLVQALNDDGIDISVETQGTFHPNWLHGCSAVCVSPKGPGMGEHTKLEELDTFIVDLCEHPGLYMKVVVFDERDLEFASMLYERYVIVRKQLRSTQFFLSQGNPYPPGMDQTGLAMNPLPLPFVLMEKYKDTLDDVMQHPVLCNVKFLPQMHVLLWGNKQGV